MMITLVDVRYVLVTLSKFNYVCTVYTTHTLMNIGDETRANEKMCHINTHPVVCALFNFFVFLL